MNNKVKGISGSREPLRMLDPLAKNSCEKAIATIEGLIPIGGLTQPIIDSLFLRLDYAQ